MDQINEIRNILIVLNKKMDYIEKISNKAFETADEAKQISKLNSYKT